MGRQWLHAKRAVASMKKAQATGKIVREIMVAAKMGGADPETNARLTAAMEKARKESVSRDVIEQQKEQIYSAATQGAKERVKVAFLLQKIAEKEDIKVSQEEIANRINHLAATYQMPAPKFLKDLQKRNGLIEIYDQIMNEKVLDLLQKEAKIEQETANPEIPKS